MYMPLWWTHGTNVANLRESPVAPTGTQIQVQRLSSQHLNRYVTRCKPLDEVAKYLVKAASTVFYLASGSLASCKHHALPTEYQKKRIITFEASFSSLPHFKQNHPISPECTDPHVAISAWRDIPESLSSSSLSSSRPGCGSCSYTLTMMDVCCTVNLMNGQWSRGMFWGERLSGESKTMLSFTRTK